MVFKFQSGNNLVTDRQMTWAKTICLPTLKWGDISRIGNKSLSSKSKLRGVIDKFVSFFHRIIIYGWIYIIFFHYQQKSVVNRKKTLKCKERQTFDVTMTFMTSHVGDVVVKTLEDRCGWCILSGYKCYSTSAIIVKLSDNICK